MSIEASDFLESANELALTNTEVCKRNALSRAYYAAYHLSLEKFPRDEHYVCQDKTAGMHKTYISYLIDSEIGSLKRTIGLELFKLHAKRIKADYRIEVNLQAADLALQLSSSKKVFKLINESN